MSKAKMKIKLPKYIAPGMLPTLNQHGLMTELFDSYTKEFIKYSLLKRSYKTHVAEFGAAYGAVTKQLLGKNISITINDMEKNI